MSFFPRCAVFCITASQSDRNLLGHRSPGANSLATVEQRSIGRQPWVDISMDARIFPPCRSDLQRSAARLGVSGEDRSTLAGNFRDWRSRLSNSEFTVSRERIFLRSPAQLETDPAVVLRLLEFIGRHGITPAAETERRPELARLRSRPIAPSRAPCGLRSKAFFLCRAAPWPSALCSAPDYWRALFAEWEPIVDLVDTEPEHRYTVDEHTLMAVERATELGSVTDPTRQRFAPATIQRSKIRPLAFALLFHSRRPRRGRWRCRYSSRSRWPARPWSASAYPSKNSAN